MVHLNLGLIYILIMVAIDYGFVHTLTYELVHKYYHGYAIKTQNLLFLEGFLYFIYIKYI